jgi:phosphate transport system substrate-binding protein
MNRKPWLASCFLSLLLAACGGRQLEGVVRVDGSSTVYPITEAAAEEFMRARPGQARITLGVSGTGGGFQKFCRGELDMVDASRPVQPEEVAACAAAGIEFIELPLAFDAITLVVHPGNDWLQFLDLAQLRRIWEPAAQGRVTRWNQIDPAFPDAPLRLFGAGTDSGTFDYFTEAVMGQARASRGDFTASEDDNLLVRGVAGDRHALGFFGYAYYRAHAGSLRAVPIRPAPGEAAVLPGRDSVRSGDYRPLSRPVFLYINAAALAEREAVRAFADFFLEEVSELVDEVGFVPLPEPAYVAVRQRLAERRTGSVFAGRAWIGTRIEDLLTERRP